MNKLVSALGVLLLLVSGLAAAQQPPATPQAAAQPAPGAVEPNAIRDAAQRVATAMDAGQAAKLWDGASAVTRKSVTREAFIAGINKMRQPLGNSSGRNWVSIRRQIGDGQALPPGLYASVEFLVEFAGKRTMRELVSFRLDEDGIWRFSGYVVQP